MNATTEATNDATPALRTDDLIVPSWPVPSNVHALMTTRRGGISAGPYGAASQGGLNLGMGSSDAREVVFTNRARLRAHLPSEPSWLKQVHGVRVVDAAEVGDAEADASFTDVHGIVCAILVADCMPVLFCNRQGTRVAAAHAGWRGLAAGVLEATIAASGLDPEDTIAWIGPAIGPARFEVGDDVRDAFVAHDRASSTAFEAHDHGKWHADLPALARMRLHARGVRDVFESDLCTASDAARFYSYRRDGATGRMAALIWIDRHALV